MSEYTISQVYPTDKTVLAQIDTLLSQEGIRRDGNLDYICAMFDEEYNVIGTGSCFGSTLRCFAVSSAHQGEGLLNQIITHLIEVQCARGNMHLFLYTKVKSSKFFGDLGFYEIARVEDTLVFMENRRDGFGAYLRDLEKTRTEGKSAALVMNANPFTLGHQYLVEKAAAACDTLHLFVVVRTPASCLLPCAGSWWRRAWPICRMWCSTTAAPTSSRMPPSPATS